MINPYQLGVTSPVYDADIYTPQQIQPIDSSLSGYGIPQQEQTIQYNDPYQNMSSQELLQSMPQVQITPQQIQQQSHILNDRLYLPELPEEDVSDDYYTIKRGDTLYDIAKKYNMSISDIARLNGIKNANLIRASQRLRFNDSDQNVYRDGIRRMIRRRRSNVKSERPTHSNIISHNPTTVKKQVVSTQGNGKMLPEVVVTAKRPVKKTRINRTVPRVQFKPQKTQDYINDLYADEIRQGQPIVYGASNHKVLNAFYDYLRKTGLRK